MLSGGVIAHSMQRLDKIRKLVGGLFGSGILAYFDLLDVAEIDRTGERDEFPFCLF